MKFRWVVLLVTVVIVGIAVAFLSPRPAPPPPAHPLTTTATTSTAPAIAIATAPTRPLTLFDIVKRDQPLYATTQPMGLPLDFGDAARVVLDEPIYLDDAGQMWITALDAPNTLDAVRAMDKEWSDNTHVVGDRVRYVYWMTEAGKYTPAVFVERGGVIWVITHHGQLPLPRQRKFRFAGALAQADCVAIPTDDGVSVLTIGHDVAEHFQPLVAGDDALSRPQVIQAVRGLLAWAPASPTHAGSGAARYLDGTWSMLPPADWPTRIVQLTPFLDGTVQQLRQSEGGKIELASILLDAAPVDEKSIRKLINQLSDLSQNRRDQAMADLERVGPAAWPIFHKVFDDQSPEAQERMTILMAAQTTPTIGSMTPVDGALRAVDRYPGGGVLLYAESGVTIPQPEQQEPDVIAPAWIMVRPDRSPQLLSERLVTNLQPASAKLVPMGNEWIRVDAPVGPQRFVGNALLPLLRKSELKFSDPIGIDRRGRWLFRMPGKETPTLVVDPTLPDLTPRLPVWTIRAPGGTAGWDKDGWPAIRRGGAWALHETRWAAMDDKTNPILTVAPPPATPATQPSDVGEPILIDPSGDRYFDGTSTLILHPAIGEPTTFQLPGAAAGTGPVRLIRAGDKLFLFNQAGRIVRLSIKRGRIAYDATFTRNIPNDEQPSRIWLDPAGRICIATGQAVAICFSDGRLPAEIASKMSADEVQSNQPE